MLTRSKGFVVFVLLSSVAIAYLVASAPAPLPEAQAQDASELSVKRLLEMCAAENARVRELYTKEIVGKGQEVGLSFDEKWRQPEIEAGPLPALFLRETAKSLERDPVRLGLFLGSDYPIAQANLFKGQQAEVFDRMRVDRKAHHFFIEDLGLYTAMFPDPAVAPACVTCHNEHPDTPKRDWKLDDIMGATTWTYPKATVSITEALDVLAALRRGFHDAYSAYVDKVKTFNNPPSIGEQWPTNGYYLPNPEVFMREVEQRTSPASLHLLMRP
jgi:adenylate cyclase